MLSGNEKNWYGDSDLAIVQHLGAFLKQERINRNKTQEELARQSGLDRSTISQIENGRSKATLMSFIQLLRALDQLELLEVFRFRQQFSPIQLQKMEQKKRRRASGTARNNKEDGSAW